jgi:hypothetical protein
MSDAGPAQAPLRFDYAAIGHVTVDVLADGTRRAGGSALYAALQAARLGLRALIVTSGVVAEIEELLAPYRGELEVEIHPAAQTTTLTASGWGSARVQRMLAWAGPVPAAVTVDATILHLAPVARELPGPAGAGAPFVGLTPQGLVRSWASPGAELSLTEPRPDALTLARGCHALVVSEHERAACAPMIDAARAAGAIAAVTAGSRPVTLLAAEGPPVEVAVAPSSDAVDDLGAGDVFAAALFISLARGSSPPDAVRFASAAAAVRMAGHGPGAVGDQAAIAARTPPAPAA